MMHEVILSDDQTAYAEKVGYARYLQARERGAHHYFGDIDPEENDRWSCCCEFALLLLLRAWGLIVKWNSLLDGRRVKLSKIAEIECNGIQIDAKGVEKNYKGLLVKDGGARPFHAYVLVLAEHRPRYLIPYRSMMWGHEMAKVPLAQNMAKPGHLVPQGDPRLRDMEWEIAWRTGIAGKLAG